METFNYTVLSKDGKRVSGVIEAYDEMDAARKLKASYPIVENLSHINDKGIVGAFFGSDVGGKRLNDKAFTLMCGQFATILKSGIPIARAVHLIAEKMSDKNLKNLLIEVGEDVESGRSLSASFAEKGKDLLPLTFIETIRAGEESGNLDTAFGKVQHGTAHMEGRCHQDGLGQPMLPHKFRGKLRILRGVDAFALHDNLVLGHAQIL